MRSSFSTGIGAVASTVTVAFIALQAILAAHITDAPATRRAAVASVVLQCLTTLVLASVCIKAALKRSLASPQSDLTIMFGFGIAMTTGAAVASAISLILLSHQTSGKANTDIMGIDSTGLLVASSVLLGFAYSLQLIFLVLHCLVGRSTAGHLGQRWHGATSLSITSRSNLKTIPYSHTNSSIIDRANDMDTRSIGPSFCDKSMLGSIGSVSSRTRLLPVREKKRPASLDSNAYRSSSDDHIDSSARNSIDPINQSAAFDLPAPPQRAHFLETIPASPTGSRSPSLKSSFDLPPPRRAGSRSRSYSPAPSLNESIRSIPNPSEAHIHPLFRSDSMEPPPVATPGTSVVASPIAGQVISPRSSIRSLNRMRSTSFNTVNGGVTSTSPLSRGDSFEQEEARKSGCEQDSIHEEVIKEDENEQKADIIDNAGSLAPPIPEWVIQAGQRSSMTDYQRRVLKEAAPRSDSPSS